MNQSDKTAFPLRLLCLDIDGTLLNTAYCTAARESGGSAICGRTRIDGLPDVCPAATGD